MRRVELVKISVVVKQTAVKSHLKSVGHCGLINN